MMMRLNLSADFMAFLKQTKNCESTVLLKTSKGDSLDLRSPLCQMIAFVTYHKMKNAGDIEIWCENDNDYLLLGDYLIP